MTADDRNQIAGMHERINRFLGGFDIDASRVSLPAQV